MEDIKSASLQILGIMSRLHIKMPNQTQEPWEQVAKLTSKIDDGALKLKGEACNLSSINSTLKKKNAALSKELWQLKQEMKKVNKELEESKEKVNTFYTDLDSFDEQNAPNPVANSSGNETPNDEPGTSQDQE